MAEIPDSIPLDPVQGPSDASMNVVQPTDFGLGRLGAGVSEAEQYGFRAKVQQVRAQAVADRRSIGPDLLKFQTANADQAATDAAQWNGQPGFAADQIAKAQDRAQRFAQNNQNYTPGQQAEFTRAANEHIAQFGQQVIGHEASVIGQNAVDQAQVPMNAATTQVISGYAGAKQTLLDNYDGSTKGLATNGLAAFDSAVAAAQPSVPPQYLPAWQAKMGAMRVEQAAQLSEVEAKGADAYVYKNGMAQGDALINTISSNPLAYDDVVKNGLPGIVASMPPAMAGMKKDLLTELTGMAAQARITALTNNGNAAQAQAELNDGRYDAVLQPPMKEQLQDHVLAAIRSGAPASLDQAVKQQDILQRAQADKIAILTTGVSSGLVSKDDLNALPLEKAAEIITNNNQAMRAFAADGSVRDMDSAHLQALATSAGDPTDKAAYQTRLLQQVAAKQELAQRAAGAGAWAMDTDAHGKPSAAGGAGAAQSRGVVLQSQWQSLGSLQGDAQRQAAMQYSTSMLSAQAGTGIQPAARQIVDQKIAAQLAASVTNAQPEQKMAAIQAVAATIHALPASVSLPDGSKANPQALLVAQLRAAHMSPADIQPIADFGTDPTGAKLGAYVQAAADPELKKPLGHGQDAQLLGFVRSGMQPYLNAVSANPGVQPLNEARISNGVLVARYYMAHQGMSPQAAAQAAVTNQTGNVRFMGSWYMPGQLAGGSGVDPTAHGFDIGDAGIQGARVGAAHLLGALTANNGANLLAPNGPNPISAQQILHNAQWHTQADESGLQLLVPKVGGGFTPVLDRFGRPVQATWDQLHQQAGGNAPAPFAAPPAGNPVFNGQPVPAFSRQQQFTAGVKSITSMESGFRDGQTSDAGAMGRMQVLPATAAPVAQRIFNQPLDTNRLLNDGDYNTRIGSQIWADLTNKYGPSPGGLAKAYAGYFAGPGNVDGYTDAKGYHPGFVQKFGDPVGDPKGIDHWVAQLPPKTQAYVTRGISRHFGYLMGGQ